MKEVAKRIRKDIWAYILCILIVAFIWSLVFDSLTSIKTEEKVSVFIGSYSAGFDGVDRLNDENRAEYLKIVKVNAYQIGSYMFPAFLNVLGYETGDILILPESSIENSNYSTYSIELKDNIITKYVNKSISYTSYNNTNFGINATSFINKYNNDNTNEYYLFFNKKSNKIGELSTNDSLNDSALSLLSSMI